MVRVPSDMDIRPKSADDQEWIRKLLTEHWGGTLVVAHGDRFHANALPALVAGDRQGLATYRIAAGGLEAELVTLDAAAPGRGAALIRVVRVLRAQEIAVLRVTTTNDNLGALRFYQRRGFRIVAVRPDAVAASRPLKPGIPQVGEYGIPIRDEVELELTLGPDRVA